MSNVLPVACKRCTACSHGAQLSRTKTAVRPLPATPLLAGLLARPDEASGKFTRWEPGCSRCQASS
jgi:hypothetical protein